MDTPYQKNKKDDIIACIGRRQPIGCYLLNIKFRPTGPITAKNGYLLGGLAVLAFVCFIHLRSLKSRSVLPENQLAIPDDYHTGVQNPSTSIFTLGSMSFDSEARKLVANGTTTDLTRTETRVLRIFAACPNEPIERSRLQKRDMGGRRCYSRPQSGYVHFET